jgi:hypothetical protein
MFFIGGKDMTKIWVLQGKAIKMRAILIAKPVA